MEKIIKLKTQFIIDNLLEFHQQSVDDINLATKLILDASEVKLIDTAGLQLIVEYVKTIKNKLGSIDWKPEPSVVFYKYAALIGVKNYLLLNTENTE